MTNSFKYSTLLFLLLIISCKTQLFGQAFQRYDYTPVTHGNTTLRYPWTGGFNNVQFGKADINNDGLSDLIVYDKSNNKYAVFTATTTNSTQFNFEPKFAAKIPEANGWIIIKDYNCDGIADFFTYNGVANLKVYTGFYVNDTLNFKLQQDGFYYKNNNQFFNTYCANIIKPSMADINKDGDLDIISFNVDGNKLYYYENLQKELNLGCDSLLFEVPDFCWGNVRDTFAAAYALRDTCSGKYNRLDMSGNNEQILHSGSTIDAYDVDNNGRVDVITGSISLSSVTLLYNSGTLATASILKQDISYPTYSTPFNASSFASPVFLDVNNDNNTDLLISTFDPGSANVNNIWYYKNISSDSLNLQLQQKNFLLDNTIDAGENTTPCFIDINGDGLKDILLGSGGIKDNVNPAIYKLLYYKNIGTTNYPKFHLEDDDFLNCSTLNIKELSPAAGDMDNDGDTDILVGLSDGRIIYWENVAPSGNTPDFLFKSLLKDASDNVISIGANAAPHLIDINRDGKTDLLIGERSGNINYYNGTTIGTAKFMLSTDSLGKILISHPNTAFGFTQPSIADVNTDGKYDLILGSNFNGLLWYNNIEDQLLTRANASGLLVSDYLGFRTTAVAEDITADGKLELLTGSLDGGLILFSQDPPPFQPTAVQQNEQNTLSFTLYPNPANQMISIYLPNAAAELKVQVFNLVGQEIYTTTQRTGSVIEIPASSLAAGLYLIKVADGQKEGIQKLILQH